MVGAFWFEDMKIAYVGNFSQRHCTEVHIAATLEDMGHEVLRLQEDQVVDHWPYLLVTSDTDLFLYTRTWGAVSRGALEDIKTHGIPTASYHLDLYVGLQREDGLDTDPFWQTDYVFTPDGDPRSAEVFKRKGINHHYIKPGVYKPECVPGIYKPELAHDVTFVGGGLEYMHLEWPYRHQLVRWLMDNYSGTQTTALSLQGTWPNTIIPRFGKYGHPQRVMRNQDLNDLYASAKIAVGDSVCVPDFKHTYYWSDRVYETIGRGGFLIHPFIEGLQEEFKDKETIVFYEYGNFDQLRELIDYYLEHDNERETIRMRGQDIVKTRYTYHNRLSQMLSIVFPGRAPTTKEFVLALAKPQHPDIRIGLPPIESRPPAPTMVDPKPEQALQINLGAGADPTDGYVNVDMLDLPGIDVIHNLMEFPYPFEDNTAIDIRAVDVVEHLANYTADNRPSVIAFVEECHRILKPGGKLYIQTPGYKAEFAWQDPTHVRPFHPNTFDLFDPETAYGTTNGYYSEARFNVRHEELENGNLRFWMTKK